VQQCGEIVWFRREVEQRQRQVEVREGRLGNLLRLAHDCTLACLPHFPYPLPLKRRVDGRTPEIYLHPIPLLPPPAPGRPNVTPPTTLGLCSQSHNGS
ncbi:MAG: hypothetical protein ACK55Z_37395, partial [bacterium]